MKKFLKIFSVFALICCCLFSFTGCDIFESDSNAQVEYAEPAKERKIVREVINNTYAMLTSEVQQEQGESPTNSQILAQSGDTEAEQYLAWSTEDLQLFITFISAVTNSDDFVPGKLYNAQTEQEEGGVVYGCYLLMNAYCDGDNMLTLNVWQAYDKDVKGYSDSVIVSFDIYYNEEYKPTRSIEYHHEYEEGGLGVEEEFGIHEVAYSSDGEAITYRGANTYTNGDKEIRIVDENGYNEYVEADFTEEMQTAFEAGMELVKERTYLFNFARPLAQEDQDKIFEEF